MKDENKTKKQLISELVELRRRIGEVEIKYKNAKKERDRLFNFSTDILCIAGFDGYCKESNPAWEKILGWTKEERQSKPYLDFVHPEDREPTMNVANSLKEGKAVITFENRYLCKDASYKWISWSAFPMVEEELVFAIGRDITEQKKAEEELKKGYEEFELQVNAQTAELRKRTEDLLQEKAFAENILNALKDVFFVIDLEGKFLRWNKAMNEVSGYSDEEMSLRKLTDFFIREDIQQIEDAIGKVVNEGYARIEASAVTKDGKQIPYEFAGSIFKDFKGTPIGICGIGRDITIRKRAEKEINKRVRELEEFYGIAVGRELRIKELGDTMEQMKEEIDSLKESLEEYKKQ